MDNTIKRMVDAVDGKVYSGFWQKVAIAVKDVADTESCGLLINNVTCRARYATF